MNTNNAHTPTIGILRCLLYYPMYPFWRTFFERIGARVVVSQRLSNNAFDEHRKKHTGDICLPIESAFSHAENLLNRVDWIFVPRLNQLHRDIYLCPASAGLPDLLRNVLSIKNILCFNLTPFTMLNRSDISTLKSVCRNSKKIKESYTKACEDYHEFVEFARNKPVLDAAISEYTGEKKLNMPLYASDVNGPRILMLGMPYVLGDDFVGKGIIQTMIQRGCSIVTPFMVSPEYIHEEYKFEGYHMYWTVAGMSIIALMKMAKEQNIDGVVYCSAFACGVDASIAPIAQSACRRVYNLPFLFLLLDEHSDNSHIELRIEAFLDSVIEKQLIL
jgi:predicted nucleotide-binding protein (sugar kinase/HSP70/actin superfamily)